jgi:CubicO group peptidase (beta-lactamase class C family)
MAMSGHLSRRRFGALALGGWAYMLVDGVFSPVSAARRLPEGVEPVKVRAYRDGLPRSSPEEQGIRSEDLLAFLNDVESAGLELHSFMLLRNGHVVAEAWWWPYTADRVHITHSLTKSVTACAVGIAIEEGRFALDDKVAGFFPEYTPPNASDHLRAMSVRDLLTMQTGHDRETSGSVWRPIRTSWVAEFFKIPVVHAPGSFFKYTSAASYMLSAIVTKTTGQSMADYLTPRFFEPLGIDRWRWDTSPGGISPGGNGLSWNTAASLKLGAVHARLGTWNGRRILSEQWVRAATMKQAEGDEDGAYGYQWWMGPGRSYHALGLFTQMSVVFPEQDATLAVFAAIPGSSKLKPLLWKHFPAALGSGTLRPNEAAKNLRDHTAALRVLPPLEATSSKAARQFSGKKLAVEPNDQGVKWVSFTFREGACTYAMRDENGEHHITAGLDQYLEQGTSMTGNRLHHEYRPERQPVVAGARWLSPERFEMTWQFVETAFRDTVTCTFSGQQVAIDRSVNLNSAETRLSTLVARLA